VPTLLHACALTRAAPRARVRPSRAQVEAFTELIGTMIFALLGGVADPNGTGRDGCALARLWHLAHACLLGR
jgi:hypothetical protein